MIVTCPSCHKRYMVEDAHFAAAATEKGQRQVRCSGCKHTWIHTLPPSYEQGEGKDAQAREKLRLAQTKERGIKEKKRAAVSDKRFFVKMAIFLFFMGSLAGVLYLFLPHFFPLDSLFYGLKEEHSPQSLSIQGISFSTQQTAAGETFIVWGEIANSSSQTLLLPNLRISLLAPCEEVTGKEGEARQSAKCYVATWKHPLKGIHIKGGERIVFQSPAPYATLPAFTEAEVTFEADS